MSFHPDFVRLVLEENFEDAKAVLLAPLMAIHYAHLAMLAERRIIPAAEARAIRQALDRLDLSAVRTSRFDGRDEDLFFHLERRIRDACGDDTAGYLHTARSRNDIDMTMYRMLVRRWLLDLLEASCDLRAVLTSRAREHRDTVFAAHTHTQPAQPTTLAHYLLAVAEQLERDAARLMAAFDAVNRCPLGACAITGTGFPIDRARTSELLGFDAPTGNTYGSIAAADYLLESTGAVAVLLVGLGRFAQDLLLWCTSEIGYLRLPDGLVQSSSVMPQKRNPVALEHARALASKGFGQAVAIPLAIHNTPFGDIVDTEDDLQPLVGAMFKDALRATRLLASALEPAEFDVARMRERAAQGWITVTELADTLARDHDLPFRTAHSVAAAVVRRSAERPGSRLNELVAEASAELCDRTIRLSDSELATALSPEHFVAVRRTPGGPAPEVVALALDEASARLAGDRAAIAARRAQLAAAETKRQQAVAAL